MQQRLGFAALVMALVGSVHDAEAQTGPYIEVGLGMGLAPPLTAQGSDNDWGTKCDLIINPLLAEVGNECDTAPPQTSWTNEFDGGSGIEAGLAIGYDWGSIRLEGEYFHRVTAYDSRVSINILDDVTLDKREQEIDLAEGMLDDLQSHSLFVNLYYDFGPAKSSWSPYVGGGLGVERARLDYGTVWKRNDDPERIATFVDPLLRAKVAGTTTIGDARLSSVSIGYQLLGGIDYRLRDPVAVGVKFRWADSGKFMSEPTPWNQLRSHESSVGRGETILYQLVTDDNRFWSVSLRLKVWF